MIKNETIFFKSKILFFTRLPIKTRIMTSSHLTFMIYFHRHDLCKFTRLGTQGGAARCSNFVLSTLTTSTLVDGARFLNFCHLTHARHHFERVSQNCARLVPRMVTIDINLHQLQMFLQKQTFTFQTVRIRQKLPCWHRKLQYVENYRLI